MPNFITRIALPSNSQQDYQALETEMKKASFKDVKKANARRSGSTTPVEFNRNGNYTLLEVTDAAAKAVRKTGKEYAFTVIREKN